MYFHNEVERILRAAAEFGVMAGVILGLAVIAFFLYKVIVRQRFLRSLRMRKLTPQDVYARLEGGVDLQIIDLRHDYDVKALPKILPNALRVPMEGIEDHLDKFPKEDDILLCCN